MGPGGGRGELPRRAGSATEPGRPPALPRAGAEAGASWGPRERGLAAPRAEEPWPAQTVLGSPGSALPARRDLSRSPSCSGSGHLTCPWSSRGPRGSSQSRSRPRREPRLLSSRRAVLRASRAQRLFGSGAPPALRPQVGRVAKGGATPPAVRRLSSGVYLLPWGEAVGWNRGAVNQQLGLPEFQMMGKGAQSHVLG